MEILPLKLDSLTQTDKRGFFQDYPFEKFYALNQKMGNVDTFVDFLVDKLDRRIKMNPNIWYVRDKEKPVAIFGLAQEIELSNSYGKSVHFLGSFYNFSPFAKEVFALINIHVDLFCQKSHIDIVKTKIDAEDHTNMNYLIGQNYNHYASSCKMYYDIDKWGLPQRRINQRYKIRPYKSEDKSIALKILGQHEKNELYYNPDFSIENTARILEQYFLVQSSNKTTTALIMEDATNNKVVGISLHTIPKYFNSWLTKPLVTWDLAVIDEGSRGYGLGALFFNSIIHDTKSDIEVSTMSDNSHMLKFLQRLSFQQVGKFHFLYKKFAKK